MARVPPRTRCRGEDECTRPREPERPCPVGQPASACTRGFHRRISIAADGGKTGGRLRAVLATQRQPSAAERPSSRMAVHSVQTSHAWLHVVVGFSRRVAAYPPGRWLPRLFSKASAHALTKDNNSVGRMHAWGEVMRRRPVRSTNCMFGLRGKVGRHSLATSE